MDIKRLMDLTRQNTGSHFLDSGGENGRHWQRSQKESLICDIDFYKDSVSASISTGHFFEEVFEIDEDWTKRFEDFLEANESEYNDISGLEAFAEYVGLNITYDNTCNSESDLTQNFIFAALYKEDEDWIYRHEVLFISSHNGADVRGGYSDFVAVQAQSESWLDWNISWNISECLSHPDIDPQSLDEAYQNGFSSCPTYILNNDIERVLSFNTQEGVFTVQLKDKGDDGKPYIVRIYPNLYIS